jgi:DNA-directed RNA polymerase I, II, and III subunit RPABC1
MHFQHIFNNFLNLNPTLNELVPKHILLSEEEGIEELKQLKLQPSQLPKIKIDNFDRDPAMVDAQARWYGIKKNQIVRIEGHSEAAGKRTSYRIGN